MIDAIAKRLEKYTLKRPQEILIVKAEINGNLDEITIYKGFSSSLVQSTAFDPDVPVLPDGATIISIDRLQSPYNPENPRYLQQGLTLETIELLLSEASV